MNIVMLAGRGESTKFIYNGLIEYSDINKVIITDPLDKSKLINMRIKRLGYLRVFNQLLFQLLVVRLLRIFSNKRYNLLKKALNLKSTPIPSQKILFTGKVNSDKTIETLKKLAPDLVIVNGTSIISEKVLDAIDATFINTHVGITPCYRGVHGGYWALYNKDEKNFGVTIHLVDRGIDTGNILYQATTKVNKRDNFVTYPLYQYHLALPLLKNVIDDFKSKRVKSIDGKKCKSKLYYHPTLTQYLYGLLFRNVK